MVGENQTAGGESNPLGPVWMCEEVDAFALLTHDGNLDGHGSRIALVNSAFELIG